MPISKAAIKYLRQSQKRRTRNRFMKEKIKEGIKAITKLARTKKMTEAAAQLPAITSLLDKAVKAHILHKNNAAHKKSSLARLVRV